MLKAYYKCQKCGQEQEVQDRMTITHIKNITARVGLSLHNCCGQPMVRITENYKRPYKSAREDTNRGEES